MSWQSTSATATTAMPRAWTDAADSDELRANLAALPGLGEMKIESLGAVWPSALVHDGGGPRAVASNARGRGLPGGARGVPGGQAGSQGRVVQGPAGGRTTGGRGAIVAAANGGRLKPVLLAAVMAFLALNIWTGSPLLALWIGSKIQGEESSPRWARSWRSSSA